MAELIEELKVKMRERRRQTWYNYEFNDYGSRLSVSDEMFEKVLNERVLKQPSKISSFFTKKRAIKEIYEEIISLTSLNPKIQTSVKQKLFKNYLEDLVYESMEEEDYQK